MHPIKHFTTDGLWIVAVHRDDTRVGVGRMINEKLAGEVTKLLADHYRVPVVEFNPLQESFDRR